MKFFACVVLLLTIFATTTFAASYRWYYHRDENPGKCTLNKTLILSPGQIIKDPVSPCGRIICDNGGYAVFQNCGIQSVPGCEMGSFVDTTLPFPDCCKRYITCD